MRRFNMATPEQFAENYQKFMSERAKTELAQKGKKYGSDGKGNEALSREAEDSESEASLPDGTTAKTIKQSKKSLIIKKGKGLSRKSTNTRTKLKGPSSTKLAKAYIPMATGGKKHPKDVDRSQTNVTDDKVYSGGGTVKRKQKKFKNIKQGEFDSNVIDENRRKSYINKSPLAQPDDEV